MPNTPAHRIGLVHAVYAAMGPIDAAFDRLWPRAQRTNLVDDALPGMLQAHGGITPAIKTRIAQLAQLAAQDADAVLFTCSAFAPAIEAAATSIDIPVRKPDDAMFDAALEHGVRIGMLATFAPAVASMESAFLAKSRAGGGQATLETICIPEAMAAARAGDIARHDALVAAAIPRLAHCDAIMLAHFSTSTALEAARLRTTRPVLSAPESAVQALRRVMGADAFDA